MFSCSTRTAKRWALGLGGLATALAVSPMTAQDAAPAPATIEQVLAQVRENGERQANDLKAYGDAIRQLDENVRKLADIMRTVLAENAQLKAELKSQGEALARESSTRKAADEKLIAQVTQELATALRKLEAAQPAPAVGPRPKPPERAPAVAPTTTGDAAATTPPASPAKFRQYTVQRGDTLWGISQAAKVPVARIKEANDLKTDTVQVGQVLNLPEL